MARAKKPAEANGDHNERLIAAVRELAEQVEVLRNVLDEIRVDFRHAILNDKLGCPGISSEERAGPRGTEAAPPENQQPNEDQEVDEAEEVDDDHRETIRELLEDGLTELCDQLADGVRDELREELGGLRHALDDFSTDLTWAVRTVRQHNVANATPSVRTTAQEAVDECATHSNTAGAGSEAQVIAENHPTPAEAREDRGHRATHCQSVLWPGD